MDESLLEVGYPVEAPNVVEGADAVVALDGAGVELVYLPDDNSHKIVGVAGTPHYSSEPLF